jgi:type IV secretory pathway TrbD component
LSVWPLFLKQPQVALTFGQARSGLWTAGIWHLGFWNLKGGKGGNPPCMSAQPIKFGGIGRQHCILPPVDYHGRCWQLVDQSGGLRPPVCCGAARGQIMKTGRAARIAIITIRTTVTTTGGFGLSVWPTSFWPFSGRCKTHWRAPRLPQRTRFQQCGRDVKHPPAAAEKEEQRRHVWSALAKHTAGHIYHRDVTWLRTRGIPHGGRHRAPSMCAGTTA